MLVWSELRGMVRIRPLRRSLPPKDRPLETGHIWSLTKLTRYNRLSHSWCVCFYLTERPVSSWGRGGWWSLPCWRWTSADTQDRFIFFPSLFFYSYVHWLLFILSMSYEKILNAFNSESPAVWGSQIQQISSKVLVFFSPDSVTPLSYGSDKKFTAGGNFGKHPNFSKSDGFKVVKPHISFSKCISAFRHQAKISNTIPQS